MSLTAYREKFISRNTLTSTARNGKMTFVDEKFWRVIKEICTLSSDLPITISGYINNVLTEHFETHKKDVANHIRESYESLTEDMSRL